MKTPPTPEEVKVIAAHLRKPQGLKGKEIANLMNEGNLPMNLHTLAVLNAQPNDEILEIGMANGFFVKFLLESKHNLKYTGLDYANTMVNEALTLNDKYVKLGIAKFIHGDIHQLAFKKESFDKIFTVNTFYFWDDVSVVLKEIKRILKVNGEFIISIRPKDNMETIPVTKHGFKLLETKQIITLLKKEGFNNIKKTEIKEPTEERWGKTFQRECVILKCKIIS